MKDEVEAKKGLNSSVIPHPSSLIRVLVVDDSSFMRKSLTHILESDGAIEVAGTASDGEEAILKARQLHPDVVLLDIEMPVMDGLAALVHIMAEAPTPVLMLSALSKRDATIALKALDHGALDFIPKPSGVISYDIDRMSDAIITKVKAVASINVRKLELPLPRETFQRRRLKPALRKEIIVIGASTGGPQAIGQILSSLPPDMGVAIVIVQHMEPEFLRSFAERLQWGCSLQVSIARKGEIVQAGRILIAPGDCHTLIRKSANMKRIRLGKRSASHGFSPSIDCTMESAAKAYGEATLGVLLTGIGSDGAEGMKAIKAAGGSTIAEDPSTCVVFGMPKAAIELGCIDEAVPLPRIAQAILRMT